MKPLARQRGVALLEDPLENKSSAFSTAERCELGLDGLLRPTVETRERQALRAYEALGRYPDDLSKHVYLRALQDTKEGSSTGLFSTTWQMKFGQT